MTGVHEFKIANSATVPDVALSPSLELCFVAKLVNIPDIHRVLRLTFDNFSSHGRLTQTCSEVLLLNWQDWKSTEDAMITLVGVLGSPEEATKLIQELADGGIEKERISVIKESPELRGEEAKSRSLTGAEVGAIIGGLSGLTAGAILFFVPGIGPLLALGPIASALGGAGFGAITGGLYGAFADLGIEADDYRIYEDAIRHGGTLLAVQIDKKMEGFVKEMFERHGAMDLATRSEKWHITNRHA